LVRCAQIRIQGSSVESPAFGGWWDWQGQWGNNQGSQTAYGQPVLASGPMSPSTCTPVFTTGVMKWTPSC
jgi:hypothetical protein